MYQLIWKNIKKSRQLCRVILKNQRIVIEQSGKYTNQRNHVLENQKFKAFMYIKIWKNDETSQQLCIEIS